MPIMKPDLGGCDCHFIAGAGLYVRGDGSKESPFEYSVENSAHEIIHVGGTIDLTEFPTLSTIKIVFRVHPGLYESRYIFPSGDNFDYKIIVVNESGAAISYRSSPSQTRAVAAGVTDAYSLSPVAGVAFSISL